MGRRAHIGRQIKGFAHHHALVPMVAQSSAGYRHAGYRGAVLAAPGPHCFRPDRQLREM